MENNIYSKLIDQGVQESVHSGFCTKEELVNWLKFKEDFKNTQYNEEYNREFDPWKWSL